MTLHPTRLSRILIALICAAGFAAAGSAEEPKRILFLGDSLTAGYGIDQDLAYPALIQSKIEQAGLPYEAVAAGLSGETSAGGVRRANWVMQRPVDILVLALGANDGLRGIDVADTKRNLQAIIDAAKAKNPDATIVVAGMHMPPNLGESYTRAFSAVFPELAEQNDAKLIPFLLEGVGGDPTLNLADGIHPNPDGHRIVAENVWQILEPLLRSNP